MTLSTYLSSGTPADGTAATAANTGVISGGFVLGTGASATWRTAQGNRGERGLQLVSTSTASSTVRWAMAASNSKAAFTGVLTTPQNAPSNVITVLNLRQTGGVAGRLQWNAAGELYVFDLNNTTRGLIPAGTLALNTQYIVQMLMTSPTNTTGTMAMRVLNMAGTQLAEVFGSNANFSANPFLQFDVFPGGSVGTYGWADLQMDDGRTTYIAPIPSSVSYTGSVTLTGSGTQTRDASLTVKSPLERNSEGTTSVAGSPSIAGTVSMTGTGTQSREGLAAVSGALSRTGTGVLELVATARVTGAVGLFGTGTLAIYGREYKPLTPRRTGVTTPRAEASLSYRNNTRTEVRVP
jgi:hypothetical protein